ncbi:MAG: hypothetical protein ACOCXJ_08470, partial [Planctomycetota bacterium]
MRWVLLLLLCGTGLAQEDVCDRVHAAWMADDLAQAALLLAQRTDDATARDEVRLWRARLLGSGDPAAGLVLLAGEDWRPAAVREWPEHLHGFWHQVAGEILAARDPGSATAREQLLAALAAGGQRVDADACLARLTRLYRSTGQLLRAQRCAEALWHGWPGSPWRPWAGLQLAALLGDAEPQRAADLYYAVLAHPAADAAQRNRARVALCAMLLHQDPQQVQRLADTTRAGDPHMQAWWIRAGVALDLPGARASWDGLPPAQRADVPAVPPPPSAAAQRGDVLREARSLYASGRPVAARERLRPHVLDEPQLLRLWFTIGGSVQALDRAAVIADHRLALIAALQLEESAAITLLEEAATQATDEPEALVLLLAGLRHL